MQVHLKINIIPIPTLRQLASYEQVSYHHELFYEMSTELFLLIIRDERNIIFTLNILRIKWYYVIRGDPIVIRVETWSFLQDPSVQPLRQYYLYLEFKHGKSPSSEFSFRLGQLSCPPFFLSRVITELSSLGSIPHLHSYSVAWVHTLLRINMGAVSTLLGTTRTINCGGYAQTELYTVNMVLKPCWFTLHIPRIIILIIIILR